MTEGTIWKSIVAFAIPLFLGNLFQQLYNMADSLIVGNFLGSNALAAVSSSGNLIFLLVGFFNGIAVGAGVVIARYFGAREKESLQRSIHTTIAFGLICGVVLSLVGVIFAPKILILMGTPDEVLPNSTVYFQVYFAGSIFFVMYNIFVGILQAVGDSRHPLYYLIISSITNVILDLILVAGFRFGVGAAALATTISQALSAALCLRQLLRSPEEYRVSLKKIRLDFFMLRQIISNGLPAGLQNSIIALANVVVQSNINSFGANAMAGCGAYSKVEGFAFLPITSFTSAITTFVGQNLGAEEFDRAKKGARFGILCSLLIAEGIGVITYVFSPVFIGAFCDSQAAIAFGVDKAHICALFFCLLAATHCLSAVLRGAGRAMVPMVVMLSVWCVLRVSILWIAVPITQSINTVNWVYPITWSISTVVLLIYYHKSDWLHSFQREKAE